MKKLNPLRKIHLLLMIVLLFCSGFSTVVFFGGFEFAVAGKDKLEVILTGCTTLMVMVMLLTGVLYLVRGYKKNAAVYYKAFILLMVLVTLIDFITNMVCTTMNVLLIIRCVLFVIKIIFLLLLAFGKDLGRKKTWIILYVIIGLDIAGMIVMLIIMSGTGFDFSLIGVIAALVADVTLGLAIHGKYDDKDSRGTH
jgi:hypothetical protein